MNTKLITTIFLAVGIVVWVGWDLYVNGNAIKGDTISEVVLNYAKQLALLPFIVGVIAGHLFSDFGEGPTAAIRWVQAHPLIPFLGGVVTGAICWYQGR